MRRERERETETECESLIPHYSPYIVNTDFLHNFSVLFHQRGSHCLYCSLLLRKEVTLGFMGEFYGKPNEENQITVKIATIYEIKECELCSVNDGSLFCAWNYYSG